MQEMKAQGEVDLANRPMSAPKNWHAAFSLGAEKGYSGVALYSPGRSRTACRAASAAHEFDREGRYLRGRLRRAVGGLGVYLPSGSSSQERQQAKFRFLGEVHAAAGAGATRPRIHPVRRLEHRAQGDRPQELARQPQELGLPPRGARVAHAGVRRGRLRRRLPRIEREPDQYTWWSNRGQAWAKNVGWRIDYHIATAGMATAAREASIYTKERFSDHAPLTIDYDFDLR